MPINAKHHTLRLTDKNVTSIEATSGRFKWNVNKTINRLIAAGAALLAPQKNTKVWLDTRNTILHEGLSDMKADGFGQIVKDSRSPKVKRVSK